MNRGLAILIAGLWLCGCVTQTSKGPIRPGVSRQENSTRMTKSGGDTETVVPRGPDNADANPDVLTDPCAARLHDISGAMLLFYQQHHKMPDQLEELKSVPGLGSQLDFTCATTGTPFKYFPSGLAAPNKEQRIVVFDPTPIGLKKFRWCLMASPSRPGSSATDVVPLAESVFNLYK